jgi:hypothetical protein
MIWVVFPGKEKMLPKYNGCFVSEMYNKSKGENSLFSPAKRVLLVTVCNYRLYFIVIEVPHG